MGKGRILIVEDDAVTAQYMTLVLTEEGYDVRLTVAAGEEAVEVVPEILPELILMDVKLNGTVDGITACEQIKRSHDLPIVFVSTYGDREMVSRAIQAEPSGFLAKPFTREQLVTTVETALAWHTLRK